MLDPGQDILKRNLKMFYSVNAKLGLYLDDSYLLKTGVFERVVILV